MTEIVTLVLHGAIGSWTNYEVIREGDEPYNFSDYVDEYAEIWCVTEEEAREIVDETDFYEEVEDKF